MFDSTVVGLATLVLLPVMFLAWSAKKRKLGTIRCKRCNYVGAAKGAWQIGRGIVPVCKNCQGSDWVVVPVIFVISVFLCASAANAEDHSAEVSRGLIAARRLEEQQLRLAMRSGGSTAKAANQALAKLRKEPTRVPILGSWVRPGVAGRLPFEYEVAAVGERSLVLRQPRERVPRPRPEITIRLEPQKRESHRMLVGGSFGSSASFEAVAITTDDANLFNIGDRVKIPLALIVRRKMIGIDHGAFDGFEARAITIIEVRE